MNWVKVLIAGTASALALVNADPVVANSVRISGLSDVAFGPLIAAIDRTSRQDVSICSYKNNPQNLPYAVTASGSGSGGSFLLSSGAAILPFEVQWADITGQTGGTQLQPFVPSSGFANGANGFTCSGAGANASFTLIIRGVDIANAPAGTYVGTLQLMIEPQ